LSILVSPGPEVVAIADAVATGAALSGILFEFILIP